jgi:hypothetical protein
MRTGFGWLSVAAPGGLLKSTVNRRGAQILQKIWKKPKNFSLMDAEVQEVPHWGSTNIRRHCMNCRYPGELAAGIRAMMVICGNEHLYSSLHNSKRPLRHRIVSNCGAHPASYSVTSVCFFCSDKAAEMQCLTPSSLHSKICNTWSYTSPTYLNVLAVH